MKKNGNQLSSNKSVKIDLKPSENKLHKFTMVKDGEIFKELEVPPIRLKAYMESKFEKDELDFIKKTIAIFKSEKIKINLKD